jgi:hypothetical protein
MLVIIEVLNQGDYAIKQTIFLVNYKLEILKIQYLLVAY